mmetsp:Transcript_66967/g.118905  ORF Transcript_66967/g.118905 Transcript_66967/m.118905 type:complete len:233 (-) Transcript_66967:131-829(-)
MGVTHSGVECSHVIDTNSALQGCQHQLVHFNVWPVEVQIADTVADVGLPSHFHCPHVKDLQVTVVVPSRDHALSFVVAVTEAHRPAIPGQVRARGLKDCYRLLSLASIPDLNCPIPRSGDKLWRPCIQCPIDGVDDGAMSLYVEHGLIEVLDVPDVEVALEIPCCQLALLQRGLAKGHAFERMRLLHLFDLLELPTCQLINEEASRVSGIAACSDETVGRWDPPCLKRSVVQ